MKIRNIPFGYRIENGTIHLHPTESQVVREIHAAYLDGQSLLQIAASLNERGVEYMPGAAAWNKARLKRIIEDVRYLGNETYPAIVKETDFYKAQEIKTARNTQKNVDRTADIFKLAVPVCCENCGEPDFPSGKMDMPELQYGCKNPRRDFVHGNREMHEQAHNRSKRHTLYTCTDRAACGNAPAEERGRADARQHNH